MMTEPTPPSGFVWLAGGTLQAKQAKQGFLEDKMSSNVFKRSFLVSYTFMVSVNGRTVIELPIPLANMPDVSAVLEDGLLVVRCNGETLTTAPIKVKRTDVVSLSMGC